jgi:hypothetical protein
VEAERGCGAIARVKPATSAMSDLNYHRDRVSRDSFNRTTRSVIIVIIVILVASIIVVGVCVYGSFDNDNSSAVRNDPPQAEMLH